MGTSYKRLSIKLETVQNCGQGLGCKENLCPKKTKLIGKANEIDIYISGQKCIALLDSGSQIRSVSVNMCKKLGLEVKPLEDIFLRLNGAGGHSLEYLGYSEAKLEFPGVPFEPCNALLLVVPQTDYHERVPVLLGMNILEACLGETDDFNSFSNVPSAWNSALQSFIHMKQVVSHSGSLGNVRTTKKVTVPASAQAIIHCHSRPVSTLCVPVKVAIDESMRTQLPGGLVLTPSVHFLNAGVNSHRVKVLVHNISDRDITIPAKFDIADMYNVDIVHSIDQPDHKVGEFREVSCSSQINTEVHDPLDLPDIAESEFQHFFKETLMKNLEPPQVEEVLKELSHWRHVFSLHDLDLGHTDLVKHKIQLTSDKPIKEVPRRIPPSMIEEVRNHINEMLSLGVIRKSSSPYASNVVLVRKKDNSLRFCIDYRRLNSITVKDAYALPKIDNSLDALYGSKWFSALDLKSAYWQVELQEEDKHKTAFVVGSLGFYECQRMPFGLTNAPATFQRLIETCMGDLHMSSCLLYLDDIVIYSKTYEEHLEKLIAVFKKLERAGLKLKPQKCSMFQKEIKYLGHIVSEQGVKTDPDKITAVTKWPTPTTVTELQSFLGFASFYRRFIKGFSKIAKPLHEATQGLYPNSKKKQRKLSSQKLVWGSAQQQAFNELKSRCTTTPVLAYADFHKPFILHVDASFDGLGAALYQEQDGKERPVAFASRGLSQSERRYPVHKLEFLALKWAVTEKFHDYLYGSHFEARTDNNPLTYVLTTAKLDATGQRWISQLGNYNFNIVYRSGRKNIDADGLSRIRWPQECEDVSSQSVHAVIEGTAVEHGFLENLCLPDIDSLESYLHNIDDLDYPVNDSSSFPGFDIATCASIQIKDPKDWAHIQLRDTTLGQIISLLKDNHTQIDLQNPEVRALYKVRESLVLDADQVLQRKHMTDDKENYRLVLPLDYRNLALKLCHDDLGHLGRDRTLALLQERYWPGMMASVVNHIKKCGRCLRRKEPVNQRAPLVNIKTSQPLEMICMDFLKLEPSKGNIENILVITDHYTKYAQAYPTKNQSAATTAKILFENFIVHYGFPAKIHSDQGGSFENQIMKHLCKITGNDKVRTTPYHPMSNGLTERFNRTLLGMLGTLENHQKANWKKYIAPLVHAYNCTKHDSTGYTPHYLMFHHHPRLPVDLVFQTGRNQEVPKSYPEYVKSLKKRLEHAYQLASKRIDNAQKNQKDNYDKKIRGATIEVGDRVLLRNVSLRGKQKLADKWQEQVFLVVDQPNFSIPVFKIRPEKGDGNVKVVHRNLLLPIGYIPERKHLPDDVPERKHLPDDIPERKHLPDDVPKRKHLPDDVPERKNLPDDVSECKNLPDTSDVTLLDDNSDEDEYVPVYKPVPAPRHRNGSVVQPEPVVHEPELRVPDPAVLQPDTGIEESYQSEDDSNHPNESMIMDHHHEDYDTSSSSEEENEGHQSEVHQADTPYLRPRDKIKPPSRYNPEIFKISKMLQLMPKQEMLETVQCLLLLVSEKMKAL